MSQPDRIRSFVVADEPSKVAGADVKPITYRLVCANGASLIATVPDMVDARNDGEGVREAGKSAEGLTVEVWYRSRRIAMLNGAEPHGA